MANIINFRNAPIRVQMVQGEPWFVAKDVCDLLGLKKGRNSVALLRDSEKGAHTMGVRSENGVIQDREMTIVNESGLYSLIFQSRKPAAQDFRYWVTSEVLPAIRKYGRYEVPGSKERLRLEANYEKKERRHWLDALSSKLTFADYSIIAKKFGCDAYKVSEVMEDRVTDTAIEAECMFRATHNAKLRHLLDDAGFRTEIMTKYLS
jgi:prophage antirepressor-like protein